VTESGYRPDIDGLRAIAVLSVVAFHAFPELARGGFVGVDIFFVISGYLITSILIRNLEGGNFSFLQFYSRRIRRIFPALLLVLMTCLAFGAFALFTDELQQLGKHVAGGAGFVSNLVLWNESGYFDNSADTKPLLHLWSLGIEEQFYIAWPFLLWVAFRLRLNLLLAISALAGISFALNTHGVKINSIATFYSPQTRFWELLCGALLACDLVPPPSLRQGFCLSIAGLTLIGAGLYFIGVDAAFPGWLALLPTLGAALIIAAGREAIPNRIILSSRILVWFGLISFPLYLWHWPLLSFARIVEGARPNSTLRAGLVGAAILLSWATFRLLENPIRRGDHAIFKTSALLLAAVVPAAIGLYCYKIGTTVHDDADGIGAPEAQFVGPSTPWKYDINDICMKKYPLEGSDKYLWWFCMLQRDAPPTVIMLGDSRTNDFFPGFAKNPELTFHNLLSIGACGPTWIDRSALNPEVNISPCSGYRPYDQMVMINNIISSEKSVRFAIVGSLPADFTDEYIDLLARRISFLESHNVKVILFSAGVSLGYDIRACYPRPFLEPESCQTSTDQYEFIKRNFAKLQQNLAASNPNTLFFDANAYHCDARKCFFKLDGVPLFRDQFEHLSEYASIRLFRDFSRWAESNARDIFSQPRLERPK
jgi:peptidoglycan/LPS O-acetylase OafA/YrhL